MCVFLFTETPKNPRVHLYIYTYIYANTHIYIYIYIYIHMYVHIHIYTIKVIKHSNHEPQAANDMQNHYDPHEELNEPDCLVAK